MISKFKKLFKRILRILIFKKGIYGKIGKHNRFTKGVFVNEDAIIGSNNYIGPYCMINNAHIGNFCSLAPNVKLGQADHDTTCISTFGKICNGYRGFYMTHTPTIIEDNVWIAANAIVFQGVTIGEGAVIGAGAVVNKDIPPYSIAVGVPAKIIKTRFSQKEIEDIKMHINWNASFSETKNSIYKLHYKWKNNISENRS